MSLLNASRMNPGAPRCLITGASRGLGLALARTLARNGWTLVLTARGVDDLEAVRLELAARTRVLAIAGDVSDPLHRANLAAAVATLGGLDALVNNAGSLGPSPLPAVLETPIAAYEETLRTNVVAPMAVIQVMAPYLPSGARIVNLTSDAARNPYEGWAGYGSSKAALEQVSSVLAVERPDWRVYSVDPGDMRTKMHQDAFPGEDISDRLPAEASVPGLLELLTGDLPSGRYEGRALPVLTQSLGV